MLWRLLGERSDEISLRIEEGGNNSTRDFFDLEAKDGKASITASNGVSLCRGVYHYTRHVGAGMVAWSGNALRLRFPLPDFPRTRVECPYQFRHYMNVVTFGYTTAYWDWERWEQEIDWMALHGINMPLAHVGQEIVWRRVWSEYGLSEDDLDAHFTGPAHLPWNRMGNINRHDGPPPRSWHDRQTKLQHRILRRMRELGMHPVVPAFAGIVPAALRDKLGPAEVHALEPWAGFPEEYRTYLLSPFSSLFPEIGRRFIHEYAREFGRCQYYLADSLNELELPELRNDPERFVAALGRVTAKSIHDTDPEGVWLMQGWPLYFTPRVWTKKAVKAFLDSMPDERVIIIDLCNELFPGWRKFRAFYGKPWIYGVVHNFGGNNPVNGDLKFYAKEPAKAMGSTQRGNLVGFSICPEGIENNELVYELLTDISWSKKRISLSSWIADYCRARYGSYPAAMRKAWRLLLPTCYHRFHITIRHGFQRRPYLRPVGRVDVRPGAREALEAFLACAPAMRDSSHFINDAVELAVHYIGTQVDARLRDAGRAHGAELIDFRNQCIEDSLEMLLAIDALMAHHPTACLDRWLGFARGCGSTPGESRYYAANARRLITTWGGPALAEYGSKVWNGLIRDYYVPRWRLYFEALQRGEEADLAQWEEKWIQSDDPLSAPVPVEDPIREIWGLLDVLDQWETKELEVDDEGDVIGGWTADQLSQDGVRLEWNVSQFLLDPARFQVIFQPDSPASVEVRQVRLMENGVEVARDRHVGVIGPDQSTHSAELKLIVLKPGTDYVISAILRPLDHLPSAGTVRLKSAMNR